MKLDFLSLVERVADAPRRIEFIRCGETAEFEAQAWLRGRSAYPGWRDA